MNRVNDLIGTHPSTNRNFSWCKHKDSGNQPYRELTLDSSFEQNAIDCVANWLLKHHLNDRARYELNRKKDILEKYEFINFAASLDVFPSNSKTKKGNFGEIILTEYLSEVSSIDVLIYKLHYNPNIDQSMKGDDVLLVSSEKVLLGESKFRKTPNKKAVEEAADNMNNTLTLPISLSFIADRLFDRGDIEDASVVQNIIEQATKAKIDLKNISFLLSNNKVSQYVEKNLGVIRNKDFLFISLGLYDPENFMDQCFEKAETLITRGEV